MRGQGRGWRSHGGQTHSASDKHEGKMADRTSFTFCLQSTASSEPVRRERWRRRYQVDEADDEEEGVEGRELEDDRERPDLFALDLPLERVRLLRREEPEGVLLRRGEETSVLPVAPRGVVSFMHSPMESFM